MNRLLAASMTKEQKAARKAKIKAVKAKLKAHRAQNPPAPKAKSNPARATFVSGGACSPR